MIRTTKNDLQNPIKINKNNQLDLNIGISELSSPLGQTNEGKVLPICYRCTQVPKEGLYDGFRVQGMFFCSDCQRELFSAEQGSAEYQDFILLIKGVLCRGIY